MDVQHRHLCHFPYTSTLPQSFDLSCLSCGLSFSPRLTLCDLFSSSTCLSYLSRVSLLNTLPIRTLSSSRKSSTITSMPIPLVSCPRYHLAQITMILLLVVRIVRLVETLQRNGSGPLSVSYHALVDLAILPVLLRLSSLVLFLESYLPYL